MTEVAFLRAINVGGRSMLRMTDLRDIFAAAGCGNVRTFINSGNVIFDPPKQKNAAIEKIRSALAKALGAEPGIAFRTLSALERTVDKSPFSGIRPGPHVKLYVAFLARTPQRLPKLPVVSDAEAVEAIGYENGDVFIVSRPKRQRFFGYPNGIIEKAFGVPATTRNWSTVTKIVEIAGHEKVTN